MGVLASPILGLISHPNRSPIENYPGLSSIWGTSPRLVSIESRQRRAGGSSRGAAPIEPNLACDLILCDLAGWWVGVWRRGRDKQQQIDYLWTGSDSVLSLVSTAVAATFPPSLSSPSPFALSPPLHFLTSPAFRVASAHPPIDTSHNTRVSTIGVVTPKNAHTKLQDYQSKNTPNRIIISK
ncbi:hypothetical protein D9619_006921 [Psilocybe cf. subviscida]|uniref:Uncharacterized protein n=1 Tax=Psilocybe cf. subviscida TaxID=2480587 RepID=A0A8H5B5B5_9AGAR|nr:hypothetical protein D9619_006921 [Psilocybe cf. subviscida]